MPKQQRLLALCSALFLSTLTLALFASTVQGDEKADGTTPKEDADKTGAAEKPAAAGSDGKVAKPESLREGAKESGKAGYMIGKQIADFTAADIDTKAHKLSDMGEAKAMAIIVTNVDCPMCKRFGPVLGGIEKAWKEKGVRFWYLNPMPADSDDDMRARAKLYGFESPYIVDREGKLATMLGVTSTTEVFVLKPDRTLVYRGAVSDQFGIGVALEEPRNNYLEDALRAVVAGEEVRVSTTNAPGCMLDFAPKTTSYPLTWHGQISQIVEANCVRCHRAGEGAPFELTSYRDVRNNLTMIKRVVAQRRMPPWFADQNTGHWANEARLSDAEIKAIGDWVDGGAPEGVAGEGAAVERKPYTTGWEIGEPDKTYRVGKTFTVPATGTIDYQWVTVRTDLDEDKWVSAFEIRSTVPEVVHHVLAFLYYPTSHPRGNEQQNTQGGLMGNFAGMVPGQKAMVYPDGSGKFLPKGGLLRFQIHYTVNGEASPVDITIGLKFTNGKPKKEIKTASVFNIMFAIPAGVANHQVTALHFTRSDIRIIGYLPHMHVRGSAFLYEVKPKGAEAFTKVLDIPHYDFNWQLAYVPAEHLYLPKGSYIRGTATYDNSTGNPANPDPTKVVRFGEQTWDEMMIGYFDYYEVADEKEVLK